ncbi:MAG: hypothetical protein ISS36_01530 [Candidatus Aenigmarchaeota archaeon]|nr:hypothetical protein [Candidatus Aenigmarchaeota archaeon]
MEMPLKIIVFAIVILVVVLMLIMIVSSKSGDALVAVKSFFGNLQSMFKTV